MQKKKSVLLKKVFAGFELESHIEINGPRVSLRKCRENENSYLVFFIGKRIVSIEGWRILRYRPEWHAGAFMALPDTVTPKLFEWGRYTVYGYSPIVPPF